MLSPNQTLKSSSILNKVWPSRIQVNMTVDKMPVRMDKMLVSILSTLAIFWLAFYPQAFCPSPFFSFTISGHWSNRVYLTPRIFWLTLAIIVTTCWRLWKSVDNLLLLLWHSLSHNYNGGPHLKLPSLSIHLCIQQNLPRISKNAAGKWVFSKHLNYSECFDIYLKRGHVNKVTKYKLEPLQSTILILLVFSKVFPF